MHKYEFSCIKTKHSNIHIDYVYQLRILLVLNVIFVHNQLNYLITVNHKCKLFASEICACGMLQSVRVEALKGV